jgi:inhibitor of KinA sporulation pathway (predicted exonuclease)
MISIIHTSTVTFVITVVTFLFFLSSLSLFLFQSSTWCEYNIIIILNENDEQPTKNNYIFCDGDNDSGCNRNDNQHNNTITNFIKYPMMHFNKCFTTTIIT